MALTPTVELGLGGSWLTLVLSKYSDPSDGLPRRVWTMGAELVATTYHVPVVLGTGLGEHLDLLPSDASGHDITVGSGVPEGGRGIRLDGVAGYLASSEVSNLSGALSGFALEVVLTVHALPAAGQEPAIAGLSSGEFGLTLTDAGLVRVFYNGAYTGLASSAITVGSALHLVLNRTAGSPNDSLELFVNGVSAGSATPGTFSPALSTLILGRHWTNAHYLDATYAAASEWTRVLTSSEAAAHAQAVTWTDVTDDTRGAVPLIIERGIRSDSPAQRVASTGTLTFALNNLASNSGGVTGYYSPGHASCRSGFAKGIPARVRSGSAVLFHGRVKRIAPTPGKTSGVYTAVTATDFLDRAATFLMDTPPILENVRASDVFTTIVGLMPVQPHGLVVYKGSETYTLALDNTRDEAASVLQELVRLAGSELGYIYVNREGALVHESRTTRNANHSDVEITLSDTMHGMDVAEVSDQAINRVQLTVHPRVIDSAATTVLWALVNPLEIAAGETKTLIGPYRTADAPGITTRVGGLDMVAPVSTTDYTMNDASDGSGSDRTADLIVTANYGPNGVQWVLTNSHTARAYITKLQCRGKGVYDFRTVVVRSQNDAAIAEHGVSALNLDMVYQEDPNLGQALADDLLNAYGDLSGTRVKTVSMVVGANGLPDDPHLYDISTRVAVSETVTGATGEYWINGIRLECQSGRLPLLKWWLAPAGFPVAWTAVAYNSANFTAAGGGSITVDSGDQVTYAYDVRDKTMTMQVWLQGIDVSGTVNDVEIAIPGGYVSNRAQRGYGYLSDAGTVRDANVRVAASGTKILVSRADGSAFTTTSSDNTVVSIGITFEVQ